MTLSSSENFNAERSLVEQNSRPSSEDLTSSLPLQLEEAAEHLQASFTSVVIEETIQLLGERLVVDRHKRKVGEVVVRKAIETRIVEVPVRREKLIIEQVSPEHKHLAMVELGQLQGTDINAIEVARATFPSVIEAKFTSAKAAIQFLEEIVTQPDSEQHSVQIIVVLADADLQAVHQQWLKKIQLKVYF